MVDVAYCLSSPSEYPFPPPSPTSDMGGEQEGLLPRPRPRTLAGAVEDTPPDDAVGEPLVGGGVRTLGEGTPVKNPT